MACDLSSATGGEVEWCAGAAWLLHQASTYRGLAQIAEGWPKLPDSPRHPCTSRTLKSP